MLTPADRRQAARLIVAGKPPEVVEAVFPGLDTKHPDFRGLVDAMRASAFAMERVDDGFITAQVGALLQPEDGKHVLDPDMRARLLISMRR